MFEINESEDWSDFCWERYVTRAKILEYLHLLALTDQEKAVIRDVLSGVDRKEIAEKHGLKRGTERVWEIVAKVNRRMRRLPWWVVELDKET